MSLDAIQWAWTQENLRPARKLVLLSLADRAGHRHTCWPSLARLAVDTGLNPKTIRAALADLCAAGLIARKATPGRSHTYTLCHVAAWLAERKAARAIAGENPGENAEENPGENPEENPGENPGENAGKNGSSAPAENTPPAPAQNSPRPSRSRQGRGAENGGLTSQEPDSNQAMNRKDPARPRKQPFGRFGNVLLTPEERRSLASEHGDKALRAIDKLDLWLGAHGDRYKSHYMAIYAWALRAVDEDDARAAAAAARSGAPVSVSGPASGPASDPALAPAILPTTYAHIERANQKSVARLALLGRGVIAHGQQTRHHHGTDPDPDPVQPPRG